MVRKIDKNYFDHYAGKSEPYEDIWKNHSGFTMVADLINWALADVRTVLVLGSATGKILEAFETLNVKPFGVEINAWAFEQTPRRFYKNVWFGDMREVVPRLVTQGKRFDLIFSNSLIYLQDTEIKGFLEMCRPLCNFFHFYSSFENYAVEDPYRTCLKPYKWWSEQFAAAGFTHFCDAFLWESNAAA